MDESQKNTQGVASGRSMTINPDESSPGFIAHVNARIERAKDPKNVMSLNDMFADIDRRYATRNHNQGAII
jgi:hypothetical protein